MLVIRDEQMEIFEADADRQFVSHVLDDLKSELPENSVKAEEESEMIDSGLKAMSIARAYELDDPNSQATFITMSWLYGDDFHQSPKTREILTDESIPVRKRMSEVVKNNGS